MTMTSHKKEKIGKSKATFIPKGYDWGLYFWKLPDGHLFHDNEGNLLNIPSMKGDISKMAALRKAAAHFGQPEGQPWFYAGIKRATDEKFEEQKQRLKEGLIPNLDDLGSVHDAQQGIKVFGDQE
jgi:hypothetical protein